MNGVRLSVIVGLASAFLSVCVQRVAADESEFQAGLRFVVPTTEKAKVTFYRYIDDPASKETADYSVSAYYGATLRYKALVVSYSQGDATIKLRDAENDGQNSTLDVGIGGGDKDGTSFYLGLRWMRLATLVGETDTKYTRGSGSSFLVYTPYDVYLVSPAVLNNYFLMMNVGYATPSAGLGVYGNIGGGGLVSMFDVENKDIEAYGDGLGYTVSAEGGIQYALPSKTFPVVFRAGYYGSYLGMSPDALSYTLAGFTFSAFCVF